MIITRHAVERYRQRASVEPFVTDDQIRTAIFNAIGSTVKRFNKGEFPCGGLVARVFEGKVVTFVPGFRSPGKNSRFIGSKEWRKL
jgi:hypothetical protein